MKILTISIAAYNVESYIEETLKSIIHSDYLDNVEILIVNDGSKDRTASIVSDYVSQYPDSIRLIDKINGGWGSTVNIAIREAKGKYLRLLDGDDRIITGNFKSFIERIQQCDEDIILSPYRKFYEGKDYTEEVGLKNTIIEKCIRMEKFTDFEAISMHGLTIKTESLRNQWVELREHCMYTDNCYVANCLLCSKNLIYIDIPIYDYRLGREGQSVSIKSYKKHYNDIENVANDMLSIYKNYGGNQVIKNILAYRTKAVLTTVYVVIFAMECNKENKNKLVKLDTKILREYPEIYGIMNNRIIRIARSFSFALYPFICWSVQKKHDEKSS